MFCCHIAAMRRLNPVSNWIALLAFVLPLACFQFHCKMVTDKYSKINFFCNFWENFQNNFLIILRKISANVKNNYYFVKFGRIISRNGLQIIKNYFRSFQGLFLKISSCFLENFLNYQVVSKNFKIILENFQKYFRKLMVEKHQRNFQKIIT